MAYSIQEQNFAPCNRLFQRKLHSGDKTKTNRNKFFNFTF